MNNETNPKSIGKPIVDEDKELENEIKRVAYFLRGRKGMKVRNGIELGKRVEYCTGDKLASFILQNKAKVKNLWSKEIQEKNDVIPIGNALLRYGYIHRSDRSKENKKKLTPSETQTFILDGYYTWMYEGSKVLRNVLSALLIIGFFIATCFPIWPYWAKIALWYVSVTLLIIMISFSVVRLIVFFLLWLIGIEFWIFPNLFDDTLSVVDSFKPVYSFNKSPKQDRIYRLAGALITIVVCVWIYNQPTDFDEYLNLTKQFTDDIYSGKLLSDIAEHRNQDGIKPFNVPDLQNFMKDEDSEDVDAKDKVDDDMSNEEHEEIEFTDNEEQVKDEM